MRSPLALTPVAGAALALAGCEGDQSILAPAGPLAERFAFLGWVLFSGAAAIFLIVVLLALLAIFGGERSRAGLAHSRTIVIGGILFPAVTLTALLAYGTWLSRPGVAEMRSGPEPVRIAVSGEQWWWRVVYSGPDGQSLTSANEIHIPVGRPVEFVLTSSDVIHSFWVPRLAGKVDMIPGRTTHLRLIAGSPGVFRGQCAEYCGGPHALMALEVIALEPAEFEEWLRAQAMPAAEPASEAARRGSEIFISAGCGACHAIRGTPATGNIGPDLTHVGARRSLAANTLPLTRANLARFIADGQHIKPENRMPPFRIFSAQELDALAAYLEGLT